MGVGFGLLLNYPVRGGAMGKRIGGTISSFKLRFCRYIGVLPEGAHIVEMSTGVSGTRLNDRNLQRRQPAYGSLA